MLVQWLIPKLGTMLAFSILFGVLGSAYYAYDNHSALKELEAVTSQIAGEIAYIASSAPEYSAGMPLSKEINLPGDIYGEAYILRIDPRIHGIEITLLGRNISQLAFLPRSTFINGLGRECLVMEGFNSFGEVSVGMPIGGLNQSHVLVVTKSKGLDYALKIKAR
jgi:hypothetical protein